MDRIAFKEILKIGPLLLDGAMGTVLHGRGMPIDQCFDALNRDNPAIVADIHRGYINAGSDIIETNSFGANRFKLAQHGLENDVVELNQAAVAVARRVIASSFKRILLAGSIGPLGVRLAPLGRVKAADAEAAFGEQVGALLADSGPDEHEKGVDLIILETMPDLKELASAVSAVRTHSADIPLIAMMTFTRDDRTILGDTAARVATQMSRLDVDAIGVNCSSGPVQVLRLISLINEAVPDMPLIAAPNAGWPEQLEGGRVLYPATADYFAQFARAFIDAGASLVGGCCGTTDMHIAAMRKAIDSPDMVGESTPAIARTLRPKPAMATSDEPTRLKQYLESGRFIVTVEMSPPRGVSAQRLLVGANMLKEAGANFIDVADSPLARMRMSAWAAAHLVQRDVGIETILHFPTRGRSLLRVQGDLLAAHALGIRNLFVVMGDPTKIGDYPEAMDEYDIVPTGLIHLIKNKLNSGRDQAEQAIDQPTSFTVGCALNLESVEPHNEMRLLRKKIRRGADFVLTQPVFDVEAAKSFIAAYKALYDEPILPIVVGIQPLYNSGNASFLHNEVPGIAIPSALRDRMFSAGDPQGEGVTIAREMIEELKPLVQGVYMIPVFGRYDLTADVLDVLGKDR
ncbi:MAG TPA: bifunctional homocysteine S-methyltransferase/methylenetetrahydrofolate reductase [candidate division Zixibacteria bacterium]|nr:bifunctional homocysteine S-methyltransferase/methylenetetrahydrofolate reductase [candidate division Zixibacteria bacterium]